MTERRATTDDVASLEADIALARARVTESMRALGAEIARRRDWRSWVSAHPTATLVAAAAVGFLVGRGGRSAPDVPRSPRRRR